LSECGSTNRPENAPNVDIISFGVNSAPIYRVEKSISLCLGHVTWDDFVAEWLLESVECVACKAWRWGKGWGNSRTPNTFKLKSFGDVID